MTEAPRTGRVVAHLNVLGSTRASGGRSGLATTSSSSMPTASLASVTFLQGRGEGGERTGGTREAQENSRKRKVLGIHGYANAFLQVEQGVKSRSEGVLQEKRKRTGGTREAQRKDGRGTRESLIRSSSSAG